MAAYVALLEYYMMCVLISLLYAVFFTHLQFIKIRTYALLHILPTALVLLIRHEVSLSENMQELHASRHACDVNVLRHALTDTASYHAHSEIYVDASSLCQGLKPVHRYGL